MNWLRGVGRITRITGAKSEDIAEEVARKALHLHGAPWWDAQINQILVRYPAWQAAEREFEFALARGWYIDFVYSYGEQHHVGRARTGEIAAGLVDAPHARRAEPVEVMWMRTEAPSPGGNVQG